MATVSIDVESSASPPVTVDLPKPASPGAQMLAGIVLVGLVAGLGFLFVRAVNDDLAVAAAVLLVLLALPTFVMVIWGAAVLNTGVGPRQLMELIKALLGALKESKEKAPTPDQPETPPAPTPPT
jgi:hypothetical protein